MSEISSSEVNADQSSSVEEPEVFFYPTARWKFVLLSFLTLGLYEVYWAYRCWSFVKANGRPDIRPFWRAIFTPLWFYPLHKQISGGENKNQGIMLAVAYFVLSGLGSLPEPYWLISFLTVVPMLMLVGQVNAMNVSPEIRAASNYSRFKWYHVLVSLVGGGVAFLAVASSLLIIPGSVVVSGGQLPASHKSFLMEQDLLAPDEEVIYFYSGGVLSLKEDGNFITDRRVASYWQNELRNGHYTDTAFYPDIVDIVVNESTGGFEDTEIIVTDASGAEFALYVSAEAGGDHRFVNKMMALWQSSKNESAE